MPIARRFAVLLGLGAPLLLLTSHPVSKQGQQALPSAAYAQGEPAPDRIEFYLPPPRITPPASRPLPVPRLAPAALVRYGTGSPLMEDLGASPRPPSHHAPPPGLFTVARIGRRLTYQKGYQGDVPIHLVVADLNDPEIKIGVRVAREGIGSTESFASMLHRAPPAAAITGTFFGLRSALPTGDLVVNGHAVYQGFIGTAVAFTEGNLVSFIPMGYKEKMAWHFFDGVMRAGPMLVQAGKIAVGPREEGFVSISPAARRPRTAVGITPGRKLLLLAVKEPISLWRLAKLMRSLGAYHAVAMDGGSSAGLYFHGQMVVPPARALTNALVIYADRHRYQQAKSAPLGRSLLPSARSAPRPAAAPAIVVQVQPVVDDMRTVPAGIGKRARSGEALPASAARPSSAQAPPAGVDQRFPPAPPSSAARRSPQEVTGPVDTPKPGAAGEAASGAG